MKTPCVRVIQRIREMTIAAAINTEVIQEILHRFRAIRKSKHGINLARDARLISSVVLPVTDRDSVLAIELLEKHPQLPVRDAFHAATMLHNGIETIISVDRHFDSIAKIKRVDPQDASSLL